MAILNNTGIRMGASGAGGGDAYQIEKSLRFNDDDSDYLSKTLSSSGNTETYTISLWVKRGNLGKSYQSFLSNPDSSGYDGVYFGFASDYLNIKELNSGGGQVWAWQSAARFRDASAWYHIVAAVDTTQNNDYDRLKVYVNGVQVTDFYSGYPSYPTEDFVTNFNNDTLHAISKLGSVASTTYFFDGYLAEVNFIDGEQLTASNFGKTNATTGQWIPKEYTGSYGTNGFHLKFDGTDLGEDSSGQGNDWTASTTLTVSQLTTVGTATGGLPIHNTSGDYGGTKESGYREDNTPGGSGGNVEDYLVLAIPGDTTTDVHASINTGSSAKTLSTSGTVSTSTAKSKFYGTSIDMTSATAADHWTVAASSDFDFGTGDYTIEWWHYWDDDTGYQSIVDCGYVNSNAILLQTALGNAAWNVWISGVVVIQETLAGNANLQEWTHYALVRNGTTLTLYRNGVDIGNTTSSGSTGLSGTDFKIGASAFAHKILGYIQDFRVYKGVAKYTSAFSVVNPTESLEADVSTDTPTTFDDEGNGTGNYATLNPLHHLTAATLTQGNLTTTSSAAALSTFLLTSGKWYVEHTVGASAGYNLCFSQPDHEAGNTPSGVDSKTIGYYTTGTFYWGSGASYQSALASSYTTGDVLAAAIDMDSSTIKVYKNNTLETTIDFSAGTYHRFTDGMYISQFTGYGTWNFGARPFAYTPPTDYLALNTYNLDDTEITSGEYEGNAAADGPVIWMNATPATLRISSTNDPPVEGDEVTFDSDDVDPLAGGFKIRTSSTNNDSGTTYYWSAPTTESAFKYANAQSNE